MTDPIDVLAFGLPASRGFHVAEWSVAEDEVRRRWIPVEDVKWLRWLCRSSCATRGDLRLTAVPVAHEGAWRSMPGSALWVRTESGDSARRLASFKPRPTLVLQEGTTNRMTAFWMLRAPLGSDKLERANRRLSHALSTKAGDCEPTFTFNPPGTILRQGRTRPVVVRVAEQTDELHAARLVVGDLRDRPKADPSKWNGRAPVAA